MLNRILTASRRPGTARRVLIGAVVSLTVLPFGLGAAFLGEAPAGGAPPPVAPEPRLGDVSHSALPKVKSRPTRRKRAPGVAKALQATKAQATALDSEGGPPEHIRKENVKLRRELEHLRGLQADRRSVSQALDAAGAIDSSLLVGSGRLTWPITGPLTSPFGPRWGRLHAGIDISAPGGTPIRAADSGRVVLAGTQGGYGLYTCVQHTPSLSTCYAHQSRLGTTRGASVRRGQVIGYVGNTGHSFGNHLHFETWVRGQPVDPMGFL